MSAFWSAWVTVITLAVIFGCAWLLLATRKNETFKETTDTTMGHEFDGIEEYDNPLPQWWFYLFVTTVIFGLGYLLLYPGLGNFNGLLGWSSHGQWRRRCNMPRRCTRRYSPNMRLSPSRSYSSLKTKAA